MKNNKANYDWETQRINAFLIINNKLYEEETHIKCFGKALNVDLSKYWSIDEVEDIEIKYDYTLGEVANINNKRSILCMGDINKDRKTISKYYKDISYNDYY